MSKSCEQETQTSDDELLSSDESDQSMLLSDQVRQNCTARKSDLFKKLGSAIFYGTTSFSLTVVNKTVLTSWQFPSFLAISIGQMTAAIIILYAAKRFGVISFPKFTFDIPRKLSPLPFLYLGNLVTGLGGTQAMPLPMFTAIRRIAILLTMLMEYRILNKKPSLAVQTSVWCMIGGAILAAFDDLSFTIEAYSYVMMANILTAAYSVYIKQKMRTANHIGKYGIMFYNSLLMIIPALILAWSTGDFSRAYHYEHWRNPVFFLQFLCSCVMGFVLMYSIFLCTHYNSALTAVMVGCFKNVIISYLGMFIGGDYIFSIWNCIGLNISVLGSIYYTYITFGKEDTPQKPQPKSPEQV